MPLRFKKLSQKTKYTVEKIVTGDELLNSFKLSFSSLWNWELPDVQAGFRKSRGTRDQIASICWIMEKAREFQENIYFCFTDYTLTVWITTNCGKFLKRWEYQTTIPVSWETCRWVKKQQLEPHMELVLEIEKGVSQGCILSQCLFNFYAEYIRTKAGLDEAQAGIEFA